MPQSDRTNKKGGLTGSKRVKESKTTIQDSVDKVRDTVANVVDVVSDKDSPSNTQSTPTTAPKTNQVIKSHDAFGGVKLSTFEPTTYLANDLFTDSSQLPRTTKQLADEICESIAEKKESLRVVGANLELNAEVLKTATKSEKMIQAGIDYGISRINTDIKYQQFDTTQVNYEISTVKHSQALEKLEQEKITLEGMQKETEQRRRFWQEKYNLGESRIKQAQLAKFKLDEKIGSIDIESEAID
jgi:hypothetical protein